MKIITTLFKEMLTYPGCTMFVNNCQSTFGLKATNIAVHIRMHGNKTRATNAVLRLKIRQPTLIGKAKRNAEVFSLCPVPAYNMLQ